MFYDFAKKFDDNEILFPRRGGRFYLATHQVTSNAKKIKYNGKDFWLCDADEVAAVNIGLTIFPFKKKIEKQIKEKSNKEVKKKAKKEIEKKTNEKVKKKPKKSSGPDPSKTP